MIEPLPLLAPLARYREQAEQLLAGQRAGDPVALRVFHRCHPRFLDEVVKWKPRDVGDEEIAAAALDLADAELAVARGYSFRDWAALAEHVGAVLRLDSPVRRFELASEAVIAGDVGALDALLAEDPGLVRARSARVTCHDPPVHRATLLHYVAANGVEGYRQRSPVNAVAVVTRLLRAGAEVDALAGMYGGECPTLTLLVSSTPPAEAGVQVPLVEVLLDAGAAVDGVGVSEWRSPLRTALVFGFTDAAQALVARGARVDTLVLAAGLGRAAEVERMLSSASSKERHGALALAAQLGHAEVVRILLDRGEDPDRYNPEGFHSHATPLHQAVLAGRSEVVRLLLERGARFDIRDRLWNGTALGWANYAGQRELAEALVARGAR
jgi:ankyrin repeat protein